MLQFKLQINEAITYTQIQTLIREFAQQKNISIPNCLKREIIHRSVLKQPRIYKSTRERRLEHSLNGKKVNIKYLSPNNNNSLCQSKIPSTNLYRSAKPKITWNYFDTINQPIAQSIEMGSPKPYWQAFSNSVEGFMLSSITKNDEKGDMGKICLLENEREKVAIG